MQLDVEVSPPANIMTFWLGLTHVTFDLDSCDALYSFKSRNIISRQTVVHYFLVFFVQTQSGAYEPNVHEHRWAQ